MQATGDALEGMSLEQLLSGARVNEKQEVLWSGSKIDGRLHWSIRECYRRYSPQLKTAINNYYVLAEMAAGLRQAHSAVARLSAPELSLVAEAAFPGHGALLQALSERPRRAPSELRAPFRVCVRKRPLLCFELKAGEFDSVGMRPSTGAVVCHDGRLHRTGRRLTMTHHHYHFDGVWDAPTGNDEVFKSVAPLVARAKRGLSSTVVCYGQTGTGKTHTMVGLLERTAKELVGLHVELVFFEIHGKKCYDLLSQRAQVHLRSDGNHDVHVRGARQVMLEPAEPSELLELLHQALDLRQVEVTERNPISSRSHAVCELRLSRGSCEGREGAEGPGCGVLRFVDLAGSERNYETHNMTAQMHRDSAEINTALMALKDCFRAYGTKQRAPFRASRLTQVLRSCFTDDNHRTLIIATVSPAPTDLIHTINSLSHVSFMAPSLSGCVQQVMVELPLFEASIAATKPIHRWTHQEVVAWIGAVEGGRFAHVALPPGLDGAGLMKLSTMRLSQLFDGNLREARGENEGAAWTETLGGAGRVTREDRDVVGRALFSALRRESRRIAEAEGQRRMGAGHHASAEDEAGPSRRDGTAAESVQTLRGPQGQWWLDDNSAEAADEAHAFLH